MTQSPLEHPRETSQEINNLLDVTARTASATPRAFCEELAADFKERTSQVVVRVAEGAVVGVAGTLLLKLPEVAPIVMGAGLVYTGIRAGAAAFGFIDHATKADTLAQRQAMARSSSHQIGATLSAFVESAPGMIAGGYAASRAFGAPPLYNRIGDAVERNVFAPARETYAFRGPGSVKLSSALVNREGEFNALEASKILAQRHPWTGVETGSSLDLNSLRMSRTVAGEEDFIHQLPGSTRDNVVPFHIHGPDAPVGWRPSHVDLAAVKDLGILQQGETTTYFVGEARQYAAFAKAGNGDYFAPSMRAVMVNRESGLAQRLTGQFVPGKGWHLDDPVALDFGQTLRAVSQIRATSPWLSLSQIAAKTGG